MKKPQTPTETLDHLIRFVEDPDEVANMTREEIVAALEAEGVDVEKERARLRERVVDLRRRGARRP